MKRFTKDELFELAYKVAAAHDANCVYTTDDGNVFLERDRSLAYDHNEKLVKKEFPDAGVDMYQFDKLTEELAADDKSVEACRLLVQTVSEQYKDNLKGLKKDLKKEGYSEAVINEVLNELSTHQS